MKQNGEKMFTSQFAVKKLAHEQQMELAAYSLALDSERELERSALVPMNPAYAKVTSYLQSDFKK